MNIIIAILAGLGLGGLSGLIPGIHPNLVMAILISKYTDWWVLPLGITMLISSQFFSFIRSVFFFLPSESNVLAMHPIYRFVKEGKALIALKLCIAGLMASLLAGVLLSPILIKAIPFVFNLIKEYIPFLLLLISAYLILRDKVPWGALIIFSLAGVLGVYGMKFLSQPLLVLLTGFFGLPLLLQATDGMPPQLKSSKFRIGKASMKRGVISALLSSFVLVFVPAVGPAHASLFTRGLLRRKEDFLISIGAISGFNIVFSSILLYSVGRARVGTLSMLGNLFGFDLGAITMVLLLMIAVGTISFAITMKSGKILTDYIGKINYRKFFIIIGILIFSICFYFDGFYGIVFLGLAACVGILASKLRTRMAHCMGSLVVPVLGYYFT